MDNVVAVAVRLDNGEERFFVTWGRIQHAVDDQPLTSLVLRQAARFDLGGVAVSARLCASLQEGSREPYFYEALLNLSNDRIPFGRRYDRWRSHVAGEMEEGKHLWYLGR